MKLNNTTTIAELIEARLLSPRTGNALTNVGGISTIDDLLHRRQLHEDFSSIKGFGRKALFELQALFSLIDTLGIFSNGSADKAGTTEGQEEVLSEDFPALRKHSLFAAYAECCKSLSYVGLKIQRAYFPSYEKLLPYLEADRQTLTRLLGPSPKVLNAMTALRDAFKEKYDVIMKATDDELQRAKIKDDFPFLDSALIHIVFTHQKEQGHLPLFLLAYHEICAATPKQPNAYFLCLKYGFSNGQPLTSRAIAETCHVSEVTVGKQIRKGYVSEQLDNQYFSDVPAYRALMELPYITHRSDAYLALREKESLMFPFHFFAIIFSSFSHFHLISHDGRYVLANPRCCRDLDIAALLQRIKELKSAKHEENLTIDLRVLFTEVFGACNDCEYEVLTYFLKNTDGIQLENGHLVLLRKPESWGKEIYEILKSHGKPATLDYLYAQLKELYPDCNIQSEEELSKILSTVPHIHRRYRDSTYQLDLWKNYYCGSIRSFLISILTASPEPMHIKKIMQQVSSHHLDTTEVNVKATMYNDYMDRFLTFQKGYFGLSSKQYDSIWKVHVPKFNFAVRLLHFEKFLKSHHRLPATQGNQDEFGLYRWWRTIALGTAKKVTPTQRNQVMELLKKYKLD